MITRNIFILIILLLMHQVCAQKNMTSFVKPVFPGNNSTSLSIYDANPESPDGKYICFINYPNIVQGGYEAEPVNAEVMIKDRQTGTVKKIATAKANNHNGANAIWTDSVTIAFQKDGIKIFEVYHVSGNKISGPVKGELGHKSFKGNIYFSRCKNRSKEAKFREAEEGIFVLNPGNGKETMIVSKKDILNSFMKQNPAIYDSNIKILHVEPSPDEKQIFFDFRHNWPDPKKHNAELHGCVNADGSNIRWIKERPMHVVWYDNQTMMGVDTKDPEKKICRYNLDGTILEMLGGTSTHVGASPDRQWYVGESAYYRAEEDGYTRVYLYKKGNKIPFALLAEWKNDKITWDWKAHVNPSFSADGKRVYFIRSVDDKDKYEAVYFEMADIKK